MLTFSLISNAVLCFVLIVCLRRNNKLAKLEKFAHKRRDLWLGLVVEAINWDTENRSTEQGYNKVLEKSADIMIMTKMYGVDEYIKREFNECEL